jgi:hypothetical protein
MSDVMRDIRDAMLSEIQAELGVSYKELAYLETIEQNNLRTNTDRFGVRALASSQVPGVTRFTTFTQSFEIVLTKGYAASAIDDSERVEKAYDNRENLLAIYTRLVNNKGGLPLVVLNIFSLNISEPEYLLEDKVVIQRATMDITYRLSL